MKLHIVYILLSVLAVSAQIPVDSVAVYFRIDQSQFDRAYDEKDKFIDRLRMAGDSVDHIVVRDYSPPDGVFAIYKILPQKCCKVIYNRPNII